MPQRGLILVAARLRGAGRARIGRFVLDTGSERTVVTSPVAAVLGLETVSGGGIWTASRHEQVREGTLARLDALYQSRPDFPVLVADLPPELNIHGLLGLDFFRETRLTIDFRARLVTVS